VQGELELALAEIFAEPVRITGAGRTDAGVHATGQVIDFRTASALDGSTIERGVNALLPKDIAISDIEAASEDFHSRFSATGRTYEYRIRTSRTRDPLRRIREHHLATPLDVDALRDAAGRLVGRHDFAAFAAGVRGLRDVRRAVWDAEDDLLRFEIEANAFLRGMVRGIVGTLVWVGKGKITPERFGEILRSGDRSQAGPSAPANGLCLVGVSYDTAMRSAAGRDGAKQDAAKQGVTMQAESEDDE
jgi:tRNA pseudouridine38-40 synthase